MNKSQTLYQLADEEVRKCIKVYLRLAEVSNGLSAILPEHLEDERSRVIVLAGFGALVQPCTAENAYNEWQHRQALAFDLETAITTGVYTNIRTVAENYYDELSASTDGFTVFAPENLVANPHFLPMLQHLAGIFSKAKLKTLVGSVSDNCISKPAAERFAKLLSERVDATQVVKGEILKRMESTLEGIVRDLVGRVLLESIVEAALLQKALPFLREKDYASLPGVVYDFRADFVLPNATNPKVFIEVRKSSSRHASLYAKDKMFSAINWKGKSLDLLAVLVVDGDWTQETLRVLANVFDYVVPISRVNELADSIKAYLEGDRSRLKWLIDFRIRPATPTSPSAVKTPPSAPVPFPAE